MSALNYGLTMCLSISPDLEGYEGGTKNGASTPQDPRGDMTPWMGVCFCSGDFEWSNLTSTSGSGAATDPSSTRLSLTSSKNLV